jgi:NAD(P)H-flavin reductase
MPWNLYDHEHLSGLARKPWFDYTPVVSDDPTYHGAKGLVGTVAAKSSDWLGRIAMVCGSPDMVRYTVQELEVAGLPAESIRREQFDFQGAASPTEELHDAMEAR